MLKFNSSLLGYINKRNSGIILGNGTIEISGKSFNFLPWQIGLLLRGQNPKYHDQNRNK
jgi:hypothetical protein